MSNEQLMNEVLRLPLAEQEDIGHAILENLSMKSGRVLSEAQLVEIHRRRSEYLANPATAQTFEQVEADRKAAKLARMG